MPITTLGNGDEVIKHSHCSHEISIIIRGDKQANENMSSDFKKQSATTQSKSE